MKNIPLVLGVAVATLFTGSIAFAANELDQSVSNAERNQKAGSASQVKIDALYESKRIALQDMRVTQAEIDQLNVYNRQLRAIINNQDTQIESLKKQINDIESTQQGIMPLMERMLNGLESFVSLDIPFLLEEREQRIATLRTLLLASDVTVSEKFRRVLEAYQIEIEYGRTIEAYRGEAGDSETVDFLRIGRSALMTVSLDGSHAKAWNNKTKSWSDLGGDYTRAISKGVSIARKQAAPTLLGLPIQSLGENI
ncbi:DUF3450 domain-containing protein [Pseudomonas sp. HK3]|jgi:hypothetical protein